MIKKRGGFMLLEAVLTVVIVSICLTLIAQSLWTNFRTGMRFQESVRSMIVMGNALGLIYATDASQDLLGHSLAVDKPYDKFTMTADSDVVNDHLKKVKVSLNWPQGHTQGQLDVTTIIYNPDETPGN